MYKVELHNVSKTVRGNTVLKDIHLQLECGKLYGFVGRNGSGKTMLFRTICGLIRPTTGVVKIDGKILHKDISFPEHVGVIIESPGFWKTYTGFENLKLLASIKRVISDDVIRKTLERVGLNPFDKRPVRKYSLGMKQRLGIAQAIMESPSLLVLDEPTNALDEDGVSLVRNILIEERNRGATILIASHNKEDIELLSDTTFQMSAGEVSQFSVSGRNGL